MGWQVGCYSSAALTFSASHTLISDWYGTSRLLAAILMRSSKSSGNLREIDRFEGLRFGNRTPARQHPNLRTRWSRDASKKPAYLKDMDTATSLHR